MERFNVLTGKYGTEQDDQGRSNLMATFLALSQVSPELRLALSRIDPPKDVTITARSQGEFSLDELLNTTAESMMNTLSTVIVEDGTGLAGLKSRFGPQKTTETLDRLALVLGRIEGQPDTPREEGRGSSGRRRCEGCQGPWQDGRESRGLGSERQGQG